MRLLNGLYAEAAFRKRGKLAVILEEFLRPDTLHDLDRLDDVFVPFFVDVRRTRSLELLGHPAASDADVDSSAGKVVPGRDLRRQDAGGAIGCVDYAHADPDFLSDSCQIGNERQPVQKLAPRS